jgi:uncharacterized phage protein (TIGR01671 family)
MNRELKFRVWSPLNKKMFPCYSFHTILKNKFVIGYSESFDREFILDDKNAIVQQWTGLNDYENNNIYEGDIVRYELDGTVYTQTVGWGNNGWEMIDTRLYSTPLITNLPNFEVIGNIFENSELLNNELEKN